MKLKYILQICCQSSNFGAKLLTLLTLGHISFINGKTINSNQTVILPVRILRTESLLVSGCTRQ